MAQNSRYTQYVVILHKKIVLFSTYPIYENFSVNETFSEKLPTTK